ncbi:MAG: hypothetical protein SPH23_06995 [Prevotella sp.]|nr:hypothetical protein [Prevotellaceae bacterium]MDY5250589.1 hypothetical protein [Prevotella sp.]
MKKTYIAPNTDVVEIESEMILAASGVSSNTGIGYGGVDTDGSMDAEAKSVGSSWDYWE